MAYLSGPEAIFVEKNSGYNVVIVAVSACQSLPAFHDVSNIPFNGYHGLIMYCTQLMDSHW
jgi:hypothetical protein